MIIKALNNLNSRDKRALAVFMGLALVCSIYFASGILVTYVSPPANSLEMAEKGKGFTVRVLGLQTFAAAEQLSAALLEQRQVKSVVEAIPSNQGYLLRIGPLAKRESAELLTSELYNSGYSTVKITEDCAPGSDCDRVQASSSSDRGKQTQ